jgi:hypothetical protein
MNLILFRFLWPANICIAVCMALSIGDTKTRVMLTSESFGAFTWH